MYIVVINIHVHVHVHVIILYCRLLFIQDRTLGISIHNCLRISKKPSFKFLFITQITYMYISQFHKNIIYLLILLCCIAYILMYMYIMCFWFLLGQFVWMAFYNSWTRRLWLRWWHLSWKDYFAARISHETTEHYFAHCK